MLDFGDMESLLESLGRYTVKAMRGMDLRNHLARYRASLVANADVVAAQLFSNVIHAIQLGSFPSGGSAHASELLRKSATHDHRSTSLSCRNCAEARL